VFQIALKRAIRSALFQYVTRILFTVTTEVAGSSPVESKGTTDAVIKFGSDKEFIHRAGSEHVKYDSLRD
jgi:hypothetical protein